MPTPSEPAVLGRRVRFFLTYKTFVSLLFYVVPVYLLGGGGVCSYENREKTAPSCTAKFLVPYLRLLCLLAEKLIFLIEL